MGQPEPEPAAWTLFVSPIHILTPVRSGRDCVFYSTISLGSRTIADSDSLDALADWGSQNLDFLRRFVPFYWGVPSARRLNVMMNRIDPQLLSAWFMDWGRAALRLVSAFATSSRLVLGQEPVDGKSNETSTIPVWLEKLAAGRSLEGAVVAIACNPQIAHSIRAALARPTRPACQTLPQAHQAQAPAQP